MIIITAAYKKSYTKLQENHAFTGPCDGCEIQWIDPCCVRFKCPALTNYSVGVDGYGASGYCHGVLYPVIGPGGITTVCSPKPGVVQLYLWQNERCGSYTYNNMSEPPLCEDPMPCN
jgi:hypothetical protein